MSCSYEYAPQLRSLGYRMTSQRLAILHVLRHEESHLSPADIYKKARVELPGITEPTVYRTLEFLADIGLVRPSYAVSGHLTYEIAAGTIGALVVLGLAFLAGRFLQKRARVEDHKS